MPTLKRAKDDGHLYIRGLIGGKFSTWKYVTAEAESILRSRGVLPGDEFSHDLLQRLIRDGLIRTDGSGLGSSVAESIPRIGDDPGNLPLRLDQVEDAWFLELLVPSLPAECLRSLSNSALARFGVEVGGKRYDGWSLWPSEGGLAIEIRPTTKPVNVGCWGSWPEKLDRAPWSAEPRRLSPSGTVFSAPPAETLRVPEDGSLFVDAKYLILSEPRLGSAPEVLSPRTVGRCGDWHVTEITIPNFPAPRAAEWLDRLGHGIAGPRVPIHFLTPPLWQRVDGAPVYPFGGDMLIHLPTVPAVEDPRVDIQIGPKRVIFYPSGGADALTLRVKADLLGEGIVRVQAGQSSGSALFSITESPAEADEDPIPLSVDAGENGSLGCDPWSGRSFALHAQSAQPFPVAIRAETGVVPEIEIQRGLSRARMVPEESVDRDGAPVFVLDCGGRTGIVSIDCGPFGYVALLLERGEIRSARDSRIGPMSPRDAWIRTVAPAYALAGRPLPVGSHHLRQGVHKRRFLADRSTQEKER